MTTQHTSITDHTDNGLSSVGVVMSYTHGHVTTQSSVHTVTSVVCLINLPLVASYLILMSTDLFLQILDLILMVLDLLLVVLLGHLLHLLQLLLLLRGGRKGFGAGRDWS